MADKRVYDTGEEFLNKKMRKITVIRLNSDSVEDINHFKELWNKLDPEIETVIVPKDVKFEGGENDPN